MGKCCFEDWNNLLLYVYNAKGNITQQFLVSVLVLLRSVTQGVKYKYTVQVEADGQLSDASPPLLYTHGQPYCGDGLIQGYVAH